MKNADMENADMENADMENANMENADMENANMENADMENADMENADMEYADMENSVCLKNFMFLSNIRQNSTKTNSYSNNLIGPLLILVAISFNISLMNFTIISLIVKVDYICILLER